MELISRFGTLLYDESSPTALRWSNGKSAGYVEPKGYGRVNIQGKLLLCHRIVWQMFNKPLLQGQNIDHIDGNSTNNTISNLRICNQTQNRANSVKHKRNTSGFKGVSFHKRSQKYCANIGFHGKTIYLGSFETPEEAHTAYTTKAYELFKEFTRS